MTALLDGTISTALQLKIMRCKFIVLDDKLNTDEAIQQLYEDAFCVNDDEMYEEEVKVTPDEIFFANGLKELMEDIFKCEDLTENFGDNDKLKNHYHRHCLAKDLRKVSKRASVYYDFNDVSQYRQHEKYLTSLIRDPSTHSIDSLLNTGSVIKAFRKLFEGNQTLIFSISCGFVSNQGEPVNILFNSYATDVTQNYPGNTINFLIYSRYTKTLFPIDANYLQNKFNNLVIRWNIKYNQPFKINH